MKTARRLAPVLLLAVLVLFGCEGSQEQLEARTFLEEYLEALREERVEEALAMCAPEFFENTPREEWLAKLALKRDKLGRMESFTSKKWTMEMLSNGTFVTFEYDVDYENDQATEVVTVVKPVNEERFRVFGHHIRSELIE